jgi:hypothetical protein
MAKIPTETESYQLQNYQLLMTNYLLLIERCACELPAIARTLGIGRCDGGLARAFRP